MRPVCQTAKLALQCKLSALEAGYRPLEFAEKYEELIRHFGNAFGVIHKRQTPLLNAGYAVRVALVLDQVFTFLQQHQNIPVNIVVLGAGLDVLGLWALSVAHSNVHVVEVDFGEIWGAKKDLLEDSSILADVTTQDGILSGRLKTSGDTSEKIYSWVMADLQDTYNLESKLDALDLGSRPTLVVCELVLSYISTDACDELLRLSADKICAFPGSSMTCYEPFGPSDEETSVLNSYKRSYADQFSRRLAKGESNLGKKRTGFFPLADSCQSASARLQKCGFRYAESACAQDVAAVLKKTYGKKCFRILEPFDEHISLTLHLQTYSLTAGFQLGASDSTILVRCLCPWVAGIRPQVLPGCDQGPVWLGEIEAQHDEAVRDEFTTIYQPLFEPYPAVQKMHKSALTKGLLASKCSPEESDIGQSFRNKGGHFFVATAMGNVVGGIGIRKCSITEGQLRRGSFEIHHLFVCPSHRGMGIARGLSAIAQRATLATKIVASTISILEEANAFYKSEGFERQEESTLGELTMYTYTKSFERESP